MNKVREAMNGNFAKYLKIIIMIVSFAILIFSQYRIYARVEFLSELNSENVKKLENKFESLDGRVTENEKCILKNDLSNQQIKEFFVEMKGDLKEIRASLLSLQRGMSRRSKQ